MNFQKKMQKVLFFMHFYEFAQNTAYGNLRISVFFFTFPLNISFCNAILPESLSVIKFCKNIRGMYSGTKSYRKKRKLAGLV